MGIKGTPELSPLMNANVCAILNETPNVTQPLNEVTPSCTITESPKHTCYNIELILHNQIKDGLTYTDPDTGEEKDYFEFTPVKIASFKIQQEFVSNYLNHYEINVSLTPQQYQLLYYNYKDLKCDLKIYSADADTGIVYGKTALDLEHADCEPILTIENAFCLFKDKQDIYKRLPKESVTAKDEFGKSANASDALLDNVLLQIVPNEDYLFRTARCNAIYNNCTIADAIWSIAASTKCIDAIMMIEPDNTKVYKNLVIPPILDIPSTIDLLQSRYGIYNKGVNYYYQFGVLFIYPQFETNPILPKDKSEACGSSYTKTKYATVSGTVTLDELGDGGMCHIYMVGNNSFSGMQYYHGYEGATIHIVANGKTVFQSMADEGIENNGYGFVVQHADRVVDSWRVILEALDQAGSRFGVWPINVVSTPNNEYLVEDDQNAKIGITSTKSNLKYIYDRSNMFAVQSRLNKYRRTLGMFEWNMAVPFTFRPGYRICMHFDGEDETARDLAKDTGDSLMYCTKNGTVEDVTYTFSIAKRVDNEYIFSCAASASTSLELETTYHKDGI